MDAGISIALGNRCVVGLCRQRSWRIGCAVGNSRLFLWTVAAAVAEELLGTVSRMFSEHCCYIRCWHCCWASSSVCAGRSFAAHEFAQAIGNIAVRGCPLDGLETVSRTCSAICCMIRRSADRWNSLARFTLSTQAAGDGIAAALRAAVGQAGAVQSPIFSGLLPERVDAGSCSYFHRSRVRCRILPSAPAHRRTDAPSAQQSQFSLDCCSRSRRGITRDCVAND